MTHTLYIITIIITGLLSSIMTMYYPVLKRRYRRYKMRKYINLSDMVKDEVERQLKQILND